MEEAEPEAVESDALESDTPESVGITIYDVAERAGVSIATVSHAFNRPDRVSAGTRERVLKTAQELGFVPRGRGRSASGLRRVAVTAPFSAHPSYLDRLLGVVERAAGETDIVVVDDSPGDGDPTLDVLPVRGTLDGVIIMGAAPTAHLAEQLTKAGVVAVVVDHETPLYPTVTVDDETGGALVADHLLSLGVSRPLWLSPAPASGDFVTTGEARLRGFTRRLREAGHTAQVPWVICDDTLEAARAAAAEIAALDPLPDAVFALHDQLAFGVAAGLRARGVAVPEQVRVVGYDDTQLALLGDLTTVRQPFRETGAVALDALRALYRDPTAPPVHARLSPELVVRDSTVKEGRPS